MFSRIPQFIALCNPFKVLQKSDVKALTDQVTGNVYDYESVLLGETIVMVALDASQVALILSGDRHADWICSLPRSMWLVVPSQLPVTLRSQSQSTVKRMQPMQHMMPCPMLALRLQVTT